mgnify:CR=1 FL=1
MISHKHNYIFIHLPKTAGLSIVQALTPFCDEQEYTHGHPFQSDYYKFFEALPRSAEEYYQFTFVRNPYSRLVSSYEYLKKGGQPCGYDLNARDRLNLLNKTFKEFVKDFDPRDSAVHFIPQIDFFNKDIDLVEIFKLETINKDFEKICSKIKIPKQNVPHNNKSKHTHYTEYYDDETRQIVAEKYAKDIEYFGYKFGE